MLIDFLSITAPTFINCTAMEKVSQHNYSGTILDDKLTFDANTDSICEKASQRLFFLRKLKEFNVDRSLIKIFYSLFIVSLLTFALVCGLATLVRNKNKQNCH